MSLFGGTAFLAEKLNRACETNNELRRTFRPHHGPAAAARRLAELDAADRGCDAGHGGGRVADEPDSGATPVQVPFCRQG